MIGNQTETHRSERAAQADGMRADPLLQIVLWTFWAVAVIATAFFHWRADIAAQRPVNLLGMAVYTLLSAIVGLLVVTLVELWLEPQRFLE
jgi:hypothetical protein